MLWRFGNTCYGPFEYWTSIGAYKIRVEDSPKVLGVFEDGLVVVMIERDEATIDMLIETIWSHNESIATAKGLLIQQLIKRITPSD